MQRISTLLIGVSAALVLLLAGANTTRADLYFEYDQITKGVPNQSDGRGIIKQYLTADATATDLGDAVTIIDMQAKMLYELDRGTRTYRKTEVEKLGVIPGMGPEGKEMAENPMFQAMLRSMMDSLKVTPTEEYKTIAGYKCRKYIVKVMMSTSEYWVTKEIDGYDEMKAIGEKASQLFMNNPMMKQLNIASMMNTLDGFPVHTVTEMMGGTITTTLTRMERKKLDPALFTVPADYKRIAD
ncbi:MAG: DUF4412 domain-containing protein [Desulfatitalea sp.]|nr:DUF4412 domain-containing protein [Desulfatitalea sp.]